MFNRSLFHHRPSATVRAIALFDLPLVIGLAATIAVTSRSAAPNPSALEDAMKGSEATMNYGASTLARSSASASARSS